MALRRTLVLLTAAMVPLGLLALAEAGLRLADYSGDQSLFVAAGPGDRLKANRRAGLRYFPDSTAVPTFPDESFLRRKPASGLRIFVLGESGANGFPYGYNGSFSRIVRDALQDVLPGDTVEVINLGMAAITSYALADQAREVVAQQPDAVMVFGGHNEFYGALGAASTTAFPAPPAVVRVLLRLQDLRLVRLARNLVLRARRGALSPGQADDPLMRALVGIEEIPAESPLFRRGLRQYESNLRAMVRTYRRAGVAVLLGVPVSNLRDLPPFRPGRRADGQDAAALFDQALGAFRRGDTTAAAVLFAEARELDLLRWRATTAFVAAARRVASEEGAILVDLDAHFRGAAPGGIPGKELFWDHVHPNRIGTLVVARSFTEALLGAAMPTSRPRKRPAEWAAYAERMALGPFDEAYARRQVLLLTSRWPFTPERALTTASLGPPAVSYTDSLAVSAVLGSISWASAKALLARRHTEAGDYAAAITELRGLGRQYPFDAEIREFLGDLEARRGDTVAATAAMREAYWLQPSARSAHALGVLSLAAGYPDSAIRYLDEVLRTRPELPSAHFFLARAWLARGDPARAREHAVHVTRLVPGSPELVQLLLEIDSAAARAGR